MVVRSGGGGEEEKQSIESGDPIGACALLPRPKSRAIQSALLRAMAHRKAGREKQYLRPGAVSIRFARRRAVNACGRALADHGYLKDAWGFARDLELRAHAGARPVEQRPGPGVSWSHAPAQQNIRVQLTLSADSRRCPVAAGPESRWQRGLGDPKERWRLDGDDSKPTRSFKLHGVCGGHPERTGLCWSGSVSSWSGLR